MSEHEKKHSSIGASSCERWWNCPASVKLIASLPESRKTSIHAASGTMAHTLAEEALNKKLGLGHFFPRVGTKKMVDGHEIEITEEMIEAVMFYVDVVRKEHQASNYGKLLVEHSFQLKVDPEAFGTNDACVLEEFGKLTVFDLKYGTGVRVNATDNKQLLYYALGANQLGDFSEIELVIVQPRLEDPDDRISRFKVTPSELESFENCLEYRIECTRKEKPDVKQGSHCKWCAATLICPAIRKAMTEVGLENFDEFKKPTVTAEQYTSVQLSDILKKIPLIKNWISEVETLAFEEAQRGNVIPGYKIVKSWGNRVWHPGASEEVEMLLGDKAYENKLISPAQADKLLGKELVQKWTFKPDRGTKLVPDTEKGEAVQGSNSKEAINAAFTD